MIPKSEPCEPHEPSEEDSNLTGQDMAHKNGWSKLRLQPRYPARSCVQAAALPKNAKVEIEVIAIL